MNTLLNSLLSFLTIPLAGIIICAAITLAAQTYQAALQRLPKNVRLEIQALAETAVQAVEQKYSSDNLSSDAKKQEAMTLIIQIAACLGLPLNPSYASASIEAAVFGMNLYRKLKAQETASHNPTSCYPLCQPAASSSQSGQSPASAAQSTSSLPIVIKRT